LQGKVTQKIFSTSNGKIEFVKLKQIFGQVQESNNIMINKKTKTQKNP